MNELLLLTSALIDIVLVFCAGRLGSRWLFGTILMNLFLICIFGVKFIEIFGFVTNAGNVFYACVFLATHLLIEHKKEHEALETIWFGASFVAAFMLMSQLVLLFASSGTPQETDEALSTLFLFSPRIAIASMAGFIFAQYINIVVYRKMQKYFAGRYLLLRSTTANFAAQIVDSSLFLPSPSFRCRALCYSKPLRLVLL